MAQRCCAIVEASGMDQAVVFLARGIGEGIGAPDARLRCGQRRIPADAGTRGVGSDGKPRHRHSDMSIAVLNLARGKDAGLAAAERVG